MFTPLPTAINSCSGSNPAVQHCPGQCHWLQRKHQFALQQVAVVKSAKKNGLCLWHLLGRAWLLSCNANGFTWGTPSWKSNPRKIPVHPITTVTTRVANTNSLAKQTLKYLPSSSEVQLSFLFFFSSHCVYTSFAVFPVASEGHFFMKWNIGVKLNNCKGQSSCKTSRIPLFSCLC